MLGFCLGSSREAKSSGEYGSLDTLNRTEESWDTILRHTISSVVNMLNKTTFAVPEPLQYDRPLPAPSSSLRRALGRSGSRDHQFCCLL
jgi:hypothetical protein